MMPVVNHNFNALTVSLSGSNLIEASAGTGKTYSIAIMALRLVVENDIPIQKILMVTFTKAAVAELELRVRAFIRLGLKVSRGGEINDTSITQIIQNAQERFSVEEVEKRLANAQLLLDETSVLTIHSFCQRTLSEYAFETNQIFGVETIPVDEFKQLAVRAFNEFWRQRVTTLLYDLIRRLGSSKIKKAVVFALVESTLSGKKIATDVPMPSDFLSLPYQQRCLDGVDAMNAEIKELNENIIPSMLKDLDELLIRVRGNSTAKANFLELIEDEKWEEVFNLVDGKKDKVYVQKVFPEQVAMFNKINELNEQIKTDARRFINLIAVAASEFVQSQLADEKKRRAIMNFDDMIVLLHKAVMANDNQGFIEALQKKYQAVFIDEFQDTDKDQYEIFEKLFGQKQILFYIGDPKQSIYGWRKADIFTYFKACEQVQHLHYMNTNFRSSELYIKAMNQFFKPTDDFDTFAYEDHPQGIQYNSVASPEPNKKGSLLRRGKKIVPIQIAEGPKKSALPIVMLQFIIDLLTPGNYTIDDGEKNRAVVPGDIGILVRTNWEAAIVKKYLMQLRIPSITIDDAKLLQSVEAQEIYYIMFAVYEITRGSINRALLTKLGGYNAQNILTADEDAVLKRFRTYQDTWKAKGIYVMLRQFLSDHEVYERLYDDEQTNPERVIANLQQLIEIIHKVAAKKNYDQQELIQWLKMGIEGDTREGDEYEQRIESDEAAVKIVTIHKSKGLEYNIVLAPFLDFVKNNNKISVLNYRDITDGFYYAVEKGLESITQKKWAEEQAEQENRRLLYVAITRARYQSFIFKNMGKQASNSTLSFFYNVIPKEAPLFDHVQIVECPNVDSAFRYAPQKDAEIKQYAIAQNFYLKEYHWRKTSYSSLNPEHTISVQYANARQNLTDYDQFIFKELKKGAHTGNLLHYIFEHINFADDSFWLNVVQKSLKRLTTSGNEDYAKQILNLVHHVVNCKLVPNQPDFTLNKITWDHRLNELEFDFPIQFFNTDDIQRLSTPQLPLALRANEKMEGVMNGKVDLFFKYEGKYYILDWKSNYLGDDTSEYSQENMWQAMAENNYHLQYHIYTLALCKYLRLRIPDFDYDTHFGGVFYLFVRGVRAEMSTGVFYHRPDVDIIQSMSDMMSAAINH